MVHFIAESDLSLNDVHFFVPTSSSRSRDHTMHCLLDIGVKIVLKLLLKLYLLIISRFQNFNDVIFEKISRESGLKTSAVMTKVIIHKLRGKISLVEQNTIL